MSQKWEFCGQREILTLGVDACIGRVSEADAAQNDRVLIGLLI